MSIAVLCCRALMSFDSSRLDRIRDKFREAVVRGSRPFGVEGHNMRQLPAVAPADLAAFEDLYGVTLPPEYRAFLEHVSAGGAGPGYGLVPLEDSVNYQRRDHPPEGLARPFPFTEGHSLDPDSGTEPDYEADTAGTLVLAHEGCGYLHLLVVTGQARGQVWLDGYVSDHGVMPIAGSFVDWYEQWLDSILAGGDGCWWLGP